VPSVSHTATTVVPSLSVKFTYSASPSGENSMPNRPCSTQSPARRPPRSTSSSTISPASRSTRAMTPVRDATKTSSVAGCTMRSTGSSISSTGVTATVKPSGGIDGGDVAGSAGSTAATSTSGGEVEAASAKSGPSSPPQAASAATSSAAAAPCARARHLDDTGLSDERDARSGAVGCDTGLVRATVAPGRGSVRLRFDSVAPVPIERRHGRRVLRRC
jgi:hypothetical protein